MHDNQKALELIAWLRKTYIALVDITHELDNAGYSETCGLVDGASILVRTAVDDLTDSMNEDEGD